MKNALFLASLVVRVSFVGLGGPAMVIWMAESPNLPTPFGVPMTLVVGGAMVKAIESLVGDIEDLSS